MVFAKLTSKGQVTVPKEVREKLHLKAGDTLAYELKGKTLEDYRETMDGVRARALALLWAGFWIFSS